MEYDTRPPRGACGDFLSPVRNRPVTPRGAPQTRPFPMFQSDTSGVIGSWRYLRRSGTRGNRCSPRGPWRTTPHL
ncbi:hypothetical protein CP982_14740 [Streptomyces spectabilis]|uniref:Uncharacterized protein n=1 Tax=Streptomyces spectabilis TaxID=68270 RepID=A0A5P2X5Y0_STRST|nr:hypothetical protein CP982_14740 [Streptomyces spectabilis]